MSGDASLMSTKSPNPETGGKTRFGVMSRRGFLRGAGVTAVGTALGESALEALAQDKPTHATPVLGPGVANAGWPSANTNFPANAPWPEW